MARKRISKKSNPFAGAPVENPLQLGGIETSVLDNGPGRGVRIAWINTGAGLRYKVLIDRGLDILDAEYLGQSLTWHSLTGPVAPSHAYNRGVEWLRGFYGGLLVGCGPLNTGAPFTENDIEWSLHGTHSHTPAILEAIENPDPASGKMEMKITGLIRTARVFNPNIELRRTISSTLGESAIHVHDRFVNRGNQPVPFAWLLHINFGYPLLEPEASVYCYEGKLSPIGEKAAAWFRKGNDFRTAPRPLDSHRGNGEYCTYIDAKADSRSRVTVGVVNKKRGFAVKLEYSKKQFPRLINWQHWGPDGSYTGALEPSVEGVEGRPKDRQRGWHRDLQPGQSSEHRCTITATCDQREIERLLKMAK